MRGCLLRRLGSSMDGDMSEQEVARLQEQIKTLFSEVVKMAIDIEARIARLEERQVVLERDVKEIKIQLNDTAKKSDFERLERTITEWQSGQTNRMWKLIFILITVFTAITLAAVGLSVVDVSLPNILGGH